MRSEGDPSARAAVVAEAPRRYRDFDLEGFQREGIQAIEAREDVIVAAPTGAGKTLVADWAIERVLKRGRRAIYTAPMRALCDQKYLDFRDYHGAFHGRDAVGLLTGDARIHPEAPLLVMTTEVFRGMALERPEQLEFFELLVLDELHYLDNRQRGTVWEETVIFAPRHMQLLALSSTLPNSDDLSTWLGEVRGRRVVSVKLEKRPVRLEHRLWVDPKRAGTDFREMRVDDLPPDYLLPAGRPTRVLQSRESPWVKTAVVSLVAHLRQLDRLPALVFCAGRSDCEVLARVVAERAAETQTSRLQEALASFDKLAMEYDLGTAGVRLRELVACGVAFHHAGLLPGSRFVVERLFSQGNLQVVISTSTLSVGVNMPARCVCLVGLAGNDDAGVHALTGREYGQMAGRAGRHRKDKVGWVYSILGHCGATVDDVRRYERESFEPVRSHFQPGYRSILNIIRRAEGKACRTILSAAALERVLDDVWTKSFARFDRGTNELDRARMRHDLRARAAFLQEAGFLEGATLTDKGKCCAALAGNGYEIVATEALFGGVLDEIDPVDLCVLFGAMAYASMKRRGGEPTNRDSPAVHALDERLASLETMERSFIPRGLIFRPNFAMARHVRKWAHGRTLEEIGAHLADNARGSFVDILRYSIEGIASLIRILPTGHRCLSGLKEARARLARDEVESGQDIEA